MAKNFLFLDPGTRESRILRKYLTGYEKRVLEYIITGKMPGLNIVEVDYLMGSALEASDEEILFWLYQSNRYYHTDLFLDHLNYDWFHLSATTKMKRRNILIRFLSLGLYEPPQCGDSWGEIIAEFPELAIPPPEFSNRTGCVYAHPQDSEVKKLKSHFQGEHIECLLRTAAKKNHLDLFFFNLARYSKFYFWPLPLAIYSFFRLSWEEKETYFRLREKEWKLLGDYPVKEMVDIIECYPIIIKYFLKKDQLADDWPYLRALLLSSGRSEKTVNLIANNLADVYQPRVIFGFLPVDDYTLFREYYSEIPNKRAISLSIFSDRAKTIHKSVLEEICRDQTRFRFSSLDVLITSQQTTVPLLTAVLARYFRIHTAADFRVDMCRITDWRKCNYEILLYLIESDLIPDYVISNSELLYYLTLTQTSHRHTGTAEFISSIILLSEMGEKKLARTCAKDMGLTENIFSPPRKEEYQRMKTMIDGRRKEP